MSHAWSKRGWRTKRDDSNTVESSKVYNAAQCTLAMLLRDESHLMSSSVHPQREARRWRNHNNMRLPLAIYGTFRKYCNRVYLYHIGNVELPKTSTVAPLWKNFEKDKVLGFLFWDFFSPFFLSYSLISFLLLSPDGLEGKRVIWRCQRHGNWCG